MFRYQRRIAENSLTQELNLQLENINNKIVTTNEIISTKLDALQKSITEFQDSRYNKVSSLESEKKVLGDIENKNIKLNENLNNNKKITSSLSSINSLQSENLIDNRLNILNEKVIAIWKLHTIKNRTDIQKK